MGGGLVLSRVHRSQRSQYLFYVSFYREGDLVFSRPLTRTQVHITHNVFECETNKILKGIKHIVLQLHETIYFQPILLPGEEDRGLPLLRESPLSLDPTSPPR